MKDIGKTKLELSPKKELDEAVFLMNKTYNIENAASSYETKHKEIQSHDKHTVEDF